MERKDFTATVEINAPAETIFEYIADFTRHVEWNNQPENIEKLTDGPVAVGSKFKTAEGGPRDMPAMMKFMFTYMMPIMKMIYGFGDHTYATITTLDAPNHVAWSAHLPARKGNMMAMDWEVKIEEKGDATSVVSQSVHIKPPDSSPFKRMVNDDMIAGTKKEVEENLNELKQFLEG